MDTTSATTATRAVPTSGAAQKGAHETARETARETAMKGYETTIVTRPELSDTGLQELGAKIAGIIQQYGGSVVLTEDWGKRKLAYPISKETRGQYNYLVYTGPGALVHEIERNLRIHESVIRFLSVELGSDFEPEAYKKHRINAQAAAKRREEEREARREEREAARRERQAAHSYYHESHGDSESAE